MRTDAVVQHFDQDEHDHHLQITRRVSKVSPAKSLLLSDSIHFNVMLMHKGGLIKASVVEDIYSRLRKVGRLIHLVEHTGGARRENLLQVVIIFYSYLFREKYFVLFFAAAGERQGGELGSGVCVGHPRSTIISFFVSHIFLFFCLLFSFSLQASPSFLQPISRHPFECIKKKINNPKDSPPSLRCCNKRKSKVRFDREKTMKDRELLRQVQLRVPLMTDHFLLLSSFLQFEFSNYQYSIRMFRSAFIQALSLQELWKFGMTHLC